MRMPKISFRNFLKEKVVIFDEVGSRIIKKAVLNDIPCAIIHSRKEIIHITLPLLFLMLKNAIRVLTRPRSVKLTGVARSTLLGYIYKIYLLSCIDYIKPKVVLTFIDNSPVYFWISRMYNNCEFYAIQNGIRTDAKRLHYEKPNDSGERSVNYSAGVMSMPHLFCFGKYEIDLYKKHAQNIDKFYPVGSLMGGYYKTCLARNSTKIDFDICLVSDQILSFPEGHILSGFELGVGYLHKLIHKYAAEEHLSCCIAMRASNKHDQEIEKEYFINIFGNRATIIGRNETDMFTTYAAMDRSSVIVALNSTAVFEAFGWGKKALFCNLSGDDFNQLPLPEICTMNVNDYGIFKSKLDYLRRLDENEYRKITQSPARYLMNYDFDNPAHAVIRKMVVEHLN